MSRINELMKKEESEDLEFKKSWRDEYLKTISAFANSKGGRVILGRDDERNVVGIDNWKKLLEDIPSKIREKLGLTPSVQCAEIDSKKVIIVEIESSQMPISYNGKYYQRSGSTTVEMSGSELAHFLISKFGKTWDALPSNANFEDVDMSTVNLFNQLERTVEAIKKHLSVRFEIKGLQRQDIWDYPIEAIREAVINALIHKDYLSPAEIQIKVYDDKIWMWNPGGLPKELSVEDLKREHSSYPKNPLIANVFYLAGFIELWGSGTKRIVDLCKEQGLPEPNYKEEQGGFSVWFYKDIYTEENLRKLGLNERQIKAVMYVKEEGKITNKEYQKINKVSKATATRDLTNLIEKGIFEMIGVGKREIHYTLCKPKMSQK